MIGSSINSACAWYGKTLLPFLTVDFSLIFGGPAASMAFRWSLRISRNSWSVEVIWALRKNVSFGGEVEEEEAVRDSMTGMRGVYGIEGSGMDGWERGIMEGSRWEEGMERRDCMSSDSPCGMGVS